MGTTKAEWGPAPCALVAMRTAAPSTIEARDWVAAICLRMLARMLAKLCAESHLQMGPR